MMFNRTKQNRHHSLATMVLALLLVCSLSVTAFASADLSSTIAVTGLTANSSGGKDWTASAGSAVWEGTTTSDGGCSPTYTETDGTLEFKNNSGSTQVLSFTYSAPSNGGTLTVDGEAKSSAGSFSKTLADGASVTVYAKSSTTAANTTKVTLSNIKLEVQQVTVTFKPATNGSYTVDGTQITAEVSKTAASTATYKLVATPATNYYFAGWYLGDTKVYESATISAASFASTGTVTAKFLPDPLYNQATVSSDSAYTKDQLVTIDTFYLHDSTEKLVKDGSLPGNNSAYSKTATSGTKDKIDVQYIPSRAWNDSMSVSYSGTAMGDYVDGGAQESYAYARVLSDVIRIYAKENCNISFTYASSLTTGGSTATEKNTTANIYAYITTASSATVAQVKGGTAYSGNGTTPSIALSKGNYLYIVAEGYARNRYMNLVGSSQFSMDFDYSASISNFTVEYNEKKDILTAGFRDNTGKTLTSGTINVNNVGYSIGSDGNMADMTFADLASVELKVGSVPANYVHIGWEITPEGGTTTRQYTSTYSRTLTENVTVNAIFVPKTTITMGANGYADATYTDFNGTALNGQYVARNSDCTEYYTSLADAFSKTDTVVLLAGTTINGDWTIPEGKTFVIPYGMNDKGSTTPVMGGGMSSDYCLVNLNGNLTVNGTLIVNAQQNQSTGAPGGNPGHLVVASGKTITVSGSLYAYGPVTGAGKVETTDTAKIHETMEFSDNTVVIYIYNIYEERSSKKVFPFNSMFINSIEIPVTYQQGATLTAHLALRYDTVCTAAVPIIAPSGAMMNHTAGTITKFFDHSTGQFVFRYDEGSAVSTGAFSISMDVTVISMTKNITMNSSDYYLPLSAPFRFEVEGDLTLNGKYKLLPGMTVDVKDTGKLTVSEDCEVVLYRRNDFDYRGKHANSTEQWGFTEKAYPSYPQRFNGVSYPFTFTNANMGSAKLNVDGELIVNGGLYVTNELQPEANITLTANGYNYLTGTGSIDMTNASTSLTSISEVLRAASTNDLKWDTTAVVPMKGLKADATADAAEQYVSLSGVVRGYTNESGLNVWGDDPCADGHTEVIDEAKAATCTETGLTEGKHCAVCGEVTVAQTVVDALGHTEVIDEAVAATCTTAGKTEGKHCSVCSEVIVAQTVTTALGHDWTDANGVCKRDESHKCEPHSFENGVCKNCGIGCKHQYEVTVETAPTCTAEGSKTYTCDTCNHSYTEAVEAVGHTEGEAKTENNVDATCTTAGSYDTVVYCSVCNTELSRVTTAVPTNGHSYEAEATAPTCTQTGYTTHTCTVCNDSYVDSYVDALGHKSGAEADCTNARICTVCKIELVAALGHNYESVVTEPTFDAQGYTTHTCTRCSSSYVDTYVDALTAAAKIGDTRYAALKEAVEKANDGDTITLLTDAALTEKLTISKKLTLDLNGKRVTTEIVDDYAPIYVGLSGELTVTGDGTVISQNDIVFGNFGLITIENGTFKSNATEYNAALYNMYYDGETYGTAVIKGGTFESEIWNSGCLTVEGGILNGIDNSGKTVITGGTINGTILAGDGSDAPELDGKGTILISGGAFENVVEKAWCAEGYCPAENENGTYGVQKHIEETVSAKDATCTDPGLTEGKKCSVCNEVLVEQETIDALEHDMVTDAAVAPTCTATGLTEGSHCSRCDDATTAQKTVEALGHDMQETTAAVAPSCETDGKTAVLTCANGCGKTEGGEVIDALGHDMQETAAAVAPSCETAGSTAVLTCANGCGKTEGGDAVDALGHDMQETAAAVAPTCENAGSTAVYTCANGCGKTEGGEAVDALGHKIEETAAAVAPTCESTGSTAVYTCANGCGKTEGGDVVEALGHTEGETVKENETPATCGANGSYDNVVKCATCGEELSRTTVTVEATGEHTYVDGKCVACQTECEHKWSEGKCSVCEKVCGHDFANGTCSICGANESVKWRVNVATYTVGVEAEIMMRYFVVIPDELLADDGAYATMTIAGTGDVKKIPMSDIRSTYDSSKKRWMVECGVPAAYMTKNIEMRIYDGAGNIATLYTTNAEADVYARSVQYYIESRLQKDNISDKEKNMLVAMATYGGYSQIYFREGKGNQKVDAVPVYSMLEEYGLNLADISGITHETVNRVNSKGDEQNMGLALKSFNVSLDAAVDLTLKFEIANGYDLNDFNFVLTYMDNRVEKTETVTTKMEGNRCVLVIEGIVAAYWDYEYKLTVTNTKTGQTSEWGSSVLAFVTTKIKSEKATDLEKNVVKAMYVYNQAANAYFGA